MRYKFTVVAISVKYKIILLIVKVIGLINNKIIIMQSDGCSLA